MAKEEPTQQPETEKKVRRSRTKKEIKVFTMVRNGDESGVSGVGRVLDGLVFPSGKTVVCWRSEIPSISTYDSFEDFERVHVQSHPGNETEILFGIGPGLNDKVADYRKMKSSILAKAKEVEEELIAKQKELESKLEELVEE